MTGTQGPQGNPGGKGDPGDKGDQGDEGPAGAVDQKTIDALADAVIERLKLLPITLQTIKADPSSLVGAELLKQMQGIKPGGVIQETVGYLGGAPLKLRHSPIQPQGENKAR